MSAIISATNDEWSQSGQRSERVAIKIKSKKNKTSQAEPREKSIPAKESLVPSYASDLKDNQSVRTSFRLSREGNEALIWLARDANVKFQGVLTHIAAALLSDKAFQDSKKSAEPEQDSLLDRVVADAGNLDSKARDSSVRKTYVVTKLVLRIFNSIAKAKGLSRDLLVDLALKIKRAERQARVDTLRTRYEDAMQQINSLWSQAESVEKRLQEALDADDPILNRFSMAVVVLMNLSMSIETFLKNGTSIDPDDISQSC
jgi:hypothetical protein